MSKHRFPILGLHIAIFLALMFAYEHYVVPIFGYEGFFFKPKDNNWYLLLLLVALLSLVTPVTGQKPSTMFYQLTLNFVLFPMIVLLYAENKPLDYVMQILAAYILSIALRPVLKLAPPRFGTVSKSKLLHILFMLSVVYIGMVFLLGGAKYLNFDFTKVYDLRSEAANNLPDIFGYISPLVGKVIVPVAFVLCLLYKKYLMAFVFFCFAALIFGLTAHKAPLFYPFLILSIYLLSLRKSLPIKLNVGILIMVLVAIGDFWLYQKYGEKNDSEILGWTGTLTLERIFFLPAQINYMYYDFFSRHDWILFADSKITLGLVGYKYTLDVPHLIGQEYFNNETTGANTGWFGSGYMQAGFIGLLLYGAIIAAIFKYIDNCARTSGERGLITAAIAVPIVSLITSADLPTTFLTHGLYANLLLIACFRNPVIYLSYIDRSSGYMFPIYDVRFHRL